MKRVVTKPSLCDARDLLSSSRPCGVIVLPFLLCPRTNPCASSSWRWYLIVRSLSRKPLCLSSRLSSVEPTGLSCSLRILRISIFFLVVSLPCDIDMFSHYTSVQLVDSFVICLVLIYFVLTYATVDVRVVGWFLILKAVKG